jgi:hypothetical protein
MEFVSVAKPIFTSGEPPEPPPEPENESIRRVQKDRSPRQLGGQGDP